MRGKIISLALVIILATMSLAGCGKETDSVNSSSQNELTKVRVAVMTGNFTQYTAIIGKQQGIFEKNGIDLEITEYAAGVNTIDAVVAGQADIGNMADYAAVNRIGNTLDNTNLVIVSEIQGGDVNGFLYTAPEYTDDLKKLDGKGFINSVGTVNEYYNSTIFSYLGFDESKQNLVNSDSTTTSLALAQSGDVAAVFSSGSGSSYYEGIGWEKAIDAAELGIETYSYYMTTDAYNSSNEQVLANFLKATQESYDYIVENLDETAKYLESTLGISADDFKSDWSVADSRIGFSPEGVEHLKVIEDWAFKNGRYDEEYDISTYINTDALQKVYPDKVTINN